jgi:hypothetical protein
VRCAACHQKGFRGVPRQCAACHSATRGL